MYYFIKKLLNMNVMTYIDHPDDHYNLSLRGLGHHHLGSCFITHRSQNMTHPPVITEIESKAVYSHEGHEQIF